MLQSKSFVKKTKKGKILKVVREHYLRDDIWSGSPCDPECDSSAYKLGEDATQYTVIDTNVALHQLDFLEHAAIKDVIVCSVVLEEVRHKNQCAYQRLRTLCANAEKRFYVFANENHRDTFVQANPGEGPNDRNDRAIRRVAEWYSQRPYTRPLEVILVTNDRDNRTKAVASGLKAFSVMAYARSKQEQFPDLVDIVAVGEDEDESREASEQPSSSAPTASGREGRKSKRACIYPRHIEDERALQEGFKSGRFHQGVLRVSRFNAFEAWVSSESVGQDIMIKGWESMNRTFDGDVVAVELLPEDQWQAPSAKLPAGKAAAGDAIGDSQADGNKVDGDAEGDMPAAEVFQVAPGDHYGDDAGAASGKRPTGKVVSIIKRNWRTRGYCGSLQPLDKTSGFSSVLVCPVERKYPMIRIQTRQAATLMDKRIVVAVDSWEADSKYPSGHYVRTLGAIGDKDTETEVLLIENDIITDPFSPAVHACVPPLPWSVSPADLKQPGRKDLRHLCVCSVDPPGCKDIDDALHVRELPNGNLEVGVHIADVTNFVEAGTAMDMEAALRATTVYLVQRRIDMLPKPLTEDICSLRANVERLAFSVLWEMTPDADVVDVQFTKSVISSRAAMTYAEAQARIDDVRLTDDITVSLRNMNRIAKILRKRRADAGALQLASPEVKFEIDSETQDPLDVGMYQVRETNQMVEEMMLLANVTVAKKILEHFASCSLLRRHQEPAPRQFDPILQAAAAVGVELDVTTSRALSDSLDRAVREDDPYFNKLVRILTTRCMTQALYFSSGEYSYPEYRHYGLASPIYTHFTSPIRRYADVVVHRLLAAALGLSGLPESLRDREHMRAAADNMNKRHRNAQLAGRASVELHTLIFFHNRVVVADARVTKVKANGIVVFVPKYGIEGPVYLTGKGAVDGGEQLYVLDEEKQRVVAVDGSQQFAVFGKCAVKIEVQEGQGRRRQLVLTLVGRDQLTPDQVMA